MKLFLAAILAGAPGILGFAPSSSSLRSTSTTSLFKYKVFIDGEAGTTGLQVRGRIKAREDLEIISPPSDLRKDLDTRKQFINEADVVILCTCC
jgi:N-acetyl-gamma-glutamyl-phosphate reductase